jgi:hypothetical protein
MASRCSSETKSRASLALNQKLVMIKLSVECISKARPLVKQRQGLTLTASSFERSSIVGKMLRNIIARYKGIFREWKSQSVRQKFIIDFFLRNCHSHRNLQ